MQNLEIPIKEVKSDLPGENEQRTLSKTYWKDFLAEKNYNKDIDKMCDICINEQINKYGKRTIKCEGLLGLDNFIPKDMQATFSPEELDLMREAVDPYYWAEKNIGTGDESSSKYFQHRWYQQQMSRCSASMQLFRQGRRSGKTYNIALKILHSVLRNKGLKVLVVTPFDVQAEEIFLQIETLIRAINPRFGTYDDIIKSNVKSPTYFMKFKNGSRIRGFTTGASGGNSVRGQPGDLIVIDEADYVDQKAFNSIMGILMDNPETRLMVASTPDGERTLYRLSKIPEFKQFHFPSHVLPHYSDELDEHMRGLTDEIGYVQEVMAEFGESKAGVFQNYFIDKCISRFEPIPEDKVLGDRSNYIIIMGCDWNDDKVGTRILSLAYSAEKERFFVVSRDTVAKEGWSQVAAIEKIKQLNRKFVYDHIYVDEGFGISQVQVIKQYAMSLFGHAPADDPDLRLYDIQALNFGSSIEIEDIETSNVTKKPMKQYVVENARTNIERGLLMLDPVGDIDLINQMKGYEEKSRTVAGRITYKKSPEFGDHDLDALMIAMAGFQLQYSSLFSRLEGAVIRTVTKEEIHKPIEQTNQQAQKEAENAMKGLFGSASIGNPHRNRAGSRTAGFSSNKSGRSLSGNTRLSNRRGFWA